MTIKVAWLYPKLMSIYGDYGNVLTLKRRLEWRGTKVEVVEIGFDNTSELKKADLILMGGGQDQQQVICVQDLIGKKKPYLLEAHEKGIPALFACGGYQLMGHFYHSLAESDIDHFDPQNYITSRSDHPWMITNNTVPGSGADLPGLGIFPQYTVHFGKHKPRCIGNIVTESNSRLKLSKYSNKINNLVGFENHGGRTYFMKTQEHENIKTNGEKDNLLTRQLVTRNNETFPLGKVLKGYGNNGEDGEEGIVSNHFVGTYLHGLLMKNPHLADWLIMKALHAKNADLRSLPPLDDTLEWQAHEMLVKKTLS